MLICAIEILNIIVIISYVDSQYCFMTGRSVLAELKGVPQAEVDPRPHMLGYSNNLSFKENLAENRNKPCLAA